MSTRRRVLSAMRTGVLLMKLGGFLGAALTALSGLVLVFLRNTWLGGLLEYLALSLGVGLIVSGGIIYFKARKVYVREVTEEY